MKLKLIRYTTGLHGTLGLLFLNNFYFCYTLEDEIRKQKISGETAIPEGNYLLSLRQSQRFSEKYGHKMLWLLDVPEFEFVYIHKGNTIADTRGCLLVGNGVQKTSESAQLLSSTGAYNRLYPLVTHVMRREEIRLEITNQLVGI